LLDMSNIQSGKTSFPQQIDTLELVGSVYGNTIVDANSINIIMEALYEVQRRTLASVKTDYHHRTYTNLNIPDSRDFALHRSEGFVTAGFPVTNNPMSALLLSNANTSGLTGPKYYHSIVDVDFPLQVKFKYTPTAAGLTTTLETFFDDNNTAIFVMGIAELTDYLQDPFSTKRTVQGTPLEMVYHPDPGSGKLLASVRLRFVVPDITTRLHAKVLIVTNSKEQVTL
jgi:hypothetical protein